ncbi:MAG: DUF3576 domain-containing protein [Geminicoccaceae bacterium]
MLLITHKRKRFVALGTALSVLALVACEGVSVEEPEPYVTDQEDRIRAKSGTIHGNDKGFVLFSNRDQDDADAAAAAASEDAAPVANNAASAANPYLWQASLESLDFMPLAQADSGGGVIISDWYAPPETPDERFKVTVYILDQVLRADALKVSVFRQTSGENGWVDAAVDKATAASLEDNILKRARELRLVSSGGAESG